ncbi:hypothetical protein M422DRAFT_189093, partial [Sphaerobolus stellatus SS14]
QLLVTTQHNIAEHMHEIPMEQLLKMFQDAVALTRGIGIQYIWIDSLCIIQWNKADWEQQTREALSYFQQMKTLEKL